MLLKVLVLALVMAVSLPQAASAEQSEDCPVVFIQKRENGHTVLDHKDCLDVRVKKGRLIEDRVSDSSVTFKHRRNGKLRGTLTVSESHPSKELVLDEQSKRQTLVSVD